MFIIRLNINKNYDKVQSVKTVLTFILFLLQEFCIMPGLSDSVEIGLLLLVVFSVTEQASPGFRETSCERCVASYERCVISRAHIVETLCERL